MIRINLLPVRAARKKENIRRQASIFFLCVVFVLTAMAYITVSMSRTISKLEHNIALAQANLKEYEAKANQVEQIKKKLQKLEKKMDIIVELEAKRTGPVRFMDALTKFVVADKMWLTLLTEAQGKMKLSGIATDNKTVADFMTRLEGSACFEDVDLISSKQVNMKEGKKFKKFIITCKLSSKEPMEKPATS